MYKLPCSQNKRVHQRFSKLTLASGRFPQTTQLLSLLQQIPPPLYGLVVTAMPTPNAPWLAVFTSSHMVVVMRTHRLTCWDGGGLAGLRGPETKGRCRILILIMVACWVVYTHVLQYANNLDILGVLLICNTITKVFKCQMILNCCQENGRAERCLIGQRSSGAALFATTAAH